MTSCVNAQELDDHPGLATKMVKDPGPGKDWGKNGGVDKVARRHLNVWGGDYSRL